VPNKFNVEKPSKFLHIIKTTSLNSDGRLLKWIDSLDEMGHTSELFILEDNNLRGTETNNTIKITRTSLWWRRIFSKRKGYLFKACEFAVKSIRHIKNSNADTIIFHDVQHYLTLTLLLFNKPKNKRIIWDLHELPHKFLLNNCLTKQVIAFILNRVNGVIYTNEHRKDFLLSKFKEIRSKRYVLHNYPSKSYITADRNEIPPDLSDWLAGRSYALWLGMASTKRNFLTFYQALKPHLNEIRLVIIGRLHKDIKEQICTDPEYEFIYNKFVRHDEIVRYIDHARFSAVFYKNTSPNNFYCEPNRLYQLLTRGVPVVGGNNPQIITLVRKCNGGIILSDDGTEVAGVKGAIATLMDEHNLCVYRSSLQRFDFSKLYAWEEEFKSLIKALSGREGSVKKH